MVQDELVSISEASHVLGVSEPALRQWTADGKIKAFITPGGHRRYSRMELKRFIGVNRKLLGVKDLATELEGTARIHRKIDSSFLRTIAWDSRISEDGQQELAALGRQLLTLIIRCVTEPGRPEENCREVRDVGSGFGETLARLGLPLTDSVQAFIQHRDLIMNVTTGMMKRREGFNRRLVEAIPAVDRALDEALMALVTAHQQHRNQQSR